jgi:glucose/arabinose dehydrogenase
MFASDIGMSNIEEINIVRNGENYGWMMREGYWENADGAAAPSTSCSHFLPTS